VDLPLLERTLADAGEPGFRAKQVWEWACSGVSSYGEMTNLPKPLRARLAAEVPFSTLVAADSAVAKDRTEKVLFNTLDGRPLETVLMRYRDGRRSICVSSQSGCPLTCNFCATGRMAFGRNLTASEILDQVLHFRRTDDVNHLVFMGMGEPLMNLDAVIEASERLPDAGVAISHTTVSTVGWIPGIERLATEGPRIRLALSLHSAEEDVRSQLMPVNDRYPLRDVLSSCLRWREHRGKRVYVEYLMLANVNDQPEQAAVLAEQLKPRDAWKVNLIPYNPTPGRYKGSDRATIEAFQAVLRERGIPNTVRLTRGRDIAAACGQLAVERAGAPA
jgi:23S rRNA (adenine2503-C2)-methyltransferase